MSLTSLSALASVSGFVKGNPSIDYYKVLGFSPELVADFDDEYYRANKQKTTFDGLLTHSRLSRATMVDSDGVLKWGPHNLLTYSEEFDNAAWVNGSVTANTDIAPDGTLTADTLSLASSIGRVQDGALSISAGDKVTFGVWIKAGTATTCRIGIARSGAGTYEQNYSSTISLTSEWAYHSITHAYAYVQAGFRVIIQQNTGNTATIKCWGAHLYRSDLGGMVNNPDTGNSYVPTTSSARYLPRRGHHVWNGSAWVNEGLLIETESRTNLLHTTNALVTQTITVTAVPHTLHFTGTGTVTLSGASTDGPLVGTGTGEQNRVSLTFTPTAGLLMLIVTGTVADAQLEVGSTPSSYIPNLAASGTVNRTPDILTIPSAKLPWPTPKVIGPELVTNGTFDTDTDWTKGTGWTISGGVATHSGGTSSGLTQNGSFPVGKVYQVSLEVLGWSGLGLVTVQLDGGGGSDAFTVSSNGSYTRFVTTTLNRTRIALFTAAGWDGTIDNISVREIDPLAVSIQMDGRMTYADTGASIEAVFSRWTLDANSRIEHRLDTNSIATGQVTFLQTVSGTNDIVNSSNTAYSPGTFVPYNIASRHGSTFINGAVDGTALTADNTPTALPDLSSTDLSLAYDYMGTIRQFRVWAADLGDAGIEEASEGEPSSYLIWDASADTYIQKVYD